MTAPDFDLVVIAASAGGIEAFRQLLAGLPADFPVPIALVQHRAGRERDLLPAVLARFSRLPIKPAQAGEQMKPGTVYVAPADLHLFLDEHRALGMRDGTRIRHVLSSANPLFESAAEMLDGRVISVVLTGGGSDATEGVQAVHAKGGIVIAQHQRTSRVFGMPRSAIASGAVDYVLPLPAIARMLVELVRGGREAGRKFAETVHAAS